MKRNKSLSFNIWKYFMLLVLFVLFIIWLFQIVFLVNFYRSAKISDIKTITDEVEKWCSEDGYEINLYNLAIDNDVCIVILDKYNRILFPYDAFGGSCLLGRNCMLHANRSNALMYVNDILQSPNKAVSYAEHDELTGTEILLYGKTLEINGKLEGYLLINSPLAPVESTVTIIKQQMYIIFTALMVMGLLLSVFASKMIATPLTKITKAAGRLAKGDYKIHFEGNGYTEVYELAQTLNYASNEISKVDTRQRDLIANVSHDLRTPLTMIKAYAEMIRDLSGDNKEKREKHLRIIIDETDRLALLVSDMLNLSKLESGSDGLNITSCPIKSKLISIIERYREFSDQKGYNIIFEPDGERTVNCDIVKIEQVIYNLINNAISYTGEDKNVYVKQINIDDGIHSGVRIEVTDTGAGISEEDIKLIFDKYYRSENHKREVLGTGLGLSIAKSILKKHNYPYGVQSAIGKGSTFWFMIKSGGEPPKQ